MRASVIHSWSDRQAVSNLLFHSDLIPATLRFEALDRALNSHDVPYFVLAATVGLQGVPLGDVPSDKRAAWIQALLELARSKSKALAGRASVTLFSWSQSVVAFDILPELVSLYPVPDEGACRNIVAAVLSRMRRAAHDEFNRQLSGVASLRLQYECSSKCSQGVQGTKAHDEFRAMHEKLPPVCLRSELVSGHRRRRWTSRSRRSRRHANKPW